MDSIRSWIWIVPLVILLSWLSRRITWTFTFNDLLGSNAELMAERHLATLGILLIGILLAVKYLRPR